MSAHFGIGYLAGMFGVVAFGAVVPVVPTGAAVSVAAVLATSDSWPLIAVVVVVGAAGAYLGDLVTYAALRWAGQGLRRRIKWLRTESHAEALERVQRQISENELQTLLVSRLVPGGRIPVLLAAAIGGYSLRRYMIADLAAASLWAVVYAGIGVAGRSVFPQAWQGVLAAVGLVVVIGLIGPIRRRFATPARAGDTRPAEP